MDKGHSVWLLVILVVCLLCHLQTCEASCWERPACNETVGCGTDWVCLDLKCYKCKCKLPEQCYLMSTNDVGCDCTDSHFTGDHCRCPILPTVTATLPPIPPPQECESGWHKFNGSCYSFSDDIGDWDHAKDVCEAKHAQLVTVESQGEQDFITELAKKIKESITLEFYWIGGRYDAASKKYKWLSGAIIEPDFWDSGNKSEDIEGCLEYLIDTTSGTADALVYFCSDDDAEDGAICEKPGTATLELWDGGLDKIERAEVHIMIKTYASYITWTDCIVS